MEIKDNTTSKRELIRLGYKQGNLDFQFSKNRLLVCLETEGFRCYYVTEGWDIDLAGNKVKDDIEIWNVRDNVSTHFNMTNLKQLINLYKATHLDKDIITNNTKQNTTI